MRGGTQVSRNANAVAVKLMLAETKTAELQEHKKRRQCQPLDSPGNIQRAAEAPSLDIHKHRRGQRMEHSLQAFHADCQVCVYCKVHLAVLLHITRLVRPSTLPQRGVFVWYKETQAIPSVACSPHHVELIPELLYQYTIIQQLISSSNSDKSHP